MTKTFIQKANDTTQNQLLATALALDAQVNAYLQANPQVRPSGIHVTSLSIEYNNYLVVVIEYTTKNN